MRDDFSEPTKRVLAARVGYLCSRPDCRALTTGPQADDARSVNVGVAAHITAAAPAGPRYDPTVSPEERSGPTNGIWLCQNCAKLIDNDARRFTVAVIRAWKSDAEAAALARVGKTSGADEEVELVPNEMLEPRTVPWKSLHLLNALRYRLNEPLEAVERYRTAVELLVRAGRWSYKIGVAYPPELLRAEEQLQDALSAFARELRAAATEIDEKVAKDVGSFGLLGAPSDETVRVRQLLFEAAAATDLLLQVAPEIRRGVDLPDILELPECRRAVGALNAIVDGVNAAKIADARSLELFKAFSGTRI